MIRKNFFFLLFLAVFSQCQQQETVSFLPTENTQDMLTDLGVSVKNTENREFSYTNKQSAYFYARTHSQINSDWFSGWNVQTERIFRDYVLLVDKDSLDRSQAQATVFPHFFERIFKEKNVSEKLYLFDYQNVIALNIDSKADSLALALVGEQIEFWEFGQDMVFYKLPENDKLWVGICSKTPQKISIFQKDSLYFAQTSAKSGGFLIGLAEKKDDLVNLLKTAQKEHLTWQKARQERMQNLLTKQNYFYSSDQKLTQAIRWNTLTLDQLVTQQTGYGIYAGLPWFNDYWGRDMFISLEGACLLTGQFEIAEQILKDFAKYQNQDSSSKYFGRVPNRLRPNDIIYNTTDGTPRFVISCKNLGLYTGKIQLDTDLEKAVFIATKGSLKNWTNTSGYLTHENADTWMDAKIEGKIPWSPRGTIANDIQALWYGQLKSLEFFKKNALIQDLTKETMPISEKLLQNFRKDFWSDSLNYLADRLKADGTKDFSFRPNQLFALDLLEKTAQKQVITEQVWQKLVYPWGVASLSQDHPEFHAFHENPDFYHKDAAYHNGTVWVWNNGAAMEKMLAIGNVQTAYTLFENMTKMSLSDGAVGSLPENTDAHLQPNKSKIRQTGTFLQAWSAAEYLRVWYKHFLGFQPQEDFLLLNPQIPSQIADFRSRQRYKEGFLVSQFSRKSEIVFEYSFENLATKVQIQMPFFEKISLETQKEDKILVKILDKNMTLSHQDKTGKEKQNWVLESKNHVSETEIPFAKMEKGTWQALQEKDFLDKKRRLENEK